MCIGRRNPVFQIDLTSRTPIYEQLYKNIIELVMKGVLTEHQQLPSVRALAKDLSVNPNTVQKAYQELERDGVIYSLTGRGNFIAATKRESILSKTMDHFVDVIKEALRLGITKQELISKIEEI